MKKIGTLSCALLISGQAFAKSEEMAFEKDMEQVQSMAGCFDVDYSFAEIKALKEGYQLDSRFYDVTEFTKLRELIVPIKKSDTEMRLQHVLFSTNAEGEIQLILKHQAEDWEFQPSQFFEFEKPGHWNANQGIFINAWNRKVTSLDDGPRYQCVGLWNHEKQDPEWSCQNLAPIPGRETRDMGRTDYNVLARNTRIIHHGKSWLERQSNQKISLEESGQTALATEKGKIWYVRTEDSECQVAQTWADLRMPFWKVLMEEWESVYAQGGKLVESSSMPSKVRMQKIEAIERSYLNEQASNPNALSKAREEIQDVLAMAFTP